MPLSLVVDYDPVRVRGILLREGSDDSSIWERIEAKLASSSDVQRTSRIIDLPWPEVLEIIREYGSTTLQRQLNFRFKPTENASSRILDFIEETKKARLLKDSLTLNIDSSDIQSSLNKMGFKRQLKPFQLRDISRLLSLPHGANFSVPGAGKTTVTFALSLLVGKPNYHIFVVCPKAAFPAWRAVVRECMSIDAPRDNLEEFTVLVGDEEQNDSLLRSGARRFIMSYDLLVRQQALIANYLSHQPVHLILDESHRMKAGAGSQRGAFLINIASLPVRRDILSGTPMPQDASDMASQLSFLWPGQGFDLQIQRGSSPKSVLGNLYVRTTKKELGLPASKRIFYEEGMGEGQLALYGVVKSEILRQLTKAISNSGPDFLSARKSVMRLLQLSSNPTLALHAMTRDVSNISSGIADKVIEEGASLKMRAVCRHAREMAKAGKKVVIWTIFTQSIIDMEYLLADLNPVSIYGEILSGEPEDASSREGRLFRFHTDENCKVLIANPAAAGEGISLHTVCHDAIYLDRSYVSTHYLQSIDRIHRLGIAQDVETNIHIYRTKAPQGLGSIDLSVSRRLAQKIHNLEALLGDSDLRQLAFDEDKADDPIDYDIDMQDLVDLVEELEGKKFSSNDDEA